MARLRNKVLLLGVAVAALLLTPGCGALDLEVACQGAAAKSCVLDLDCACGVSRTSGNCAYGRSVCIDTSKQCPDYCAGIGGDLHLVCVEGTCKQLLD
jgi:hypothetical protein